MLFVKDLSGFALNKSSSQQYSILSDGLILRSGIQYTATDGKTDRFVYESTFSSNKIFGKDDGFTKINNFNVNEDVVVIEIDSMPLNFSKSDFLDIQGIEITGNSFDNTTTIFFSTSSNGNSGYIVIDGVYDPNLEKINIIFEKKVIYDPVTISGTSGDDKLFGTFDDELFIITIGEDEIDGGAGFDTAYIEFSRLENIIRLDSNLLVISLKNDDNYTIAANIEWIEINNAGTIDRWSLDNFPNYGYYGIRDSSERLPDMPDLFVANNYINERKLSDYFDHINWKQGVGVKYTFTSSDDRLSDQITITQDSSGNQIMKIIAGSGGDRISSTITVTASLEDTLMINVDETNEQTFVSKTFTLETTDNISSTSGYSEQEPNGYGDSANKVIEGIEYKGDLSSSSDTDFYYITTTGKSAINVEFNSPLNTSSDYFHIFAIHIDSQEKKIAAISTGSDSSFIFNADKAGTYFFGVESDEANGGSRYSNKSYGLTITNKSFLDFYEIEPNDGTNSEGIDGGPATPVYSGRSFSGQLSTEEDVDYYSILLDKAGVVDLSFSSPIENSLPFFHIYTQDQDGNILSAIKTGKSSNLRFEVNKAGTYYIAVRSDKANSGLRFNDQEYSINANITYSSSRLEIEPNDGGDGKPSTRLIEGVEFSGQLYSENDNDYYQIDVAQKGSITISFRSPLSSSLKYFNLYVVDKDGVLLAGTETGNNTTLDLNISEPGSYFIGVRSNFANGGTRFNDEEYSLSVSISNNSSNQEKEPNDGINSDGVDGGPATRIFSGERYTGQLSTSEDTDNFIINVEEDGFININFESPIQSSLDYFHIYVLDIDSQLIYSSETGKDISIDVNLNAGEYFIGIRSNDENGGYRHNAGEYNLTATTNNTEKSNVEKEPNGPGDSAQIIPSGVKYTGNLYNENDIDFFLIKTNESSTIDIIFNSPTNSDLPYFQVFIIKQDNNDEEVLYAVDTGKDLSFSFYAPDEANYFIGIRSNLESGGTNYDNGEYGIQATVKKGNANLEIEWNNSPEKATPIDDNIKLTGQLSDDADIDYFSFFMNDKGTVTLDFDSPINSETEFFQIGITNEDNTIIDYTKTGKDDQLVVSVDKPGAYYVYVWSDKAAGFYEYNNESYGITLSRSEGKITNEIEFNNSPDTATLIESGEIYTGRLKDNEDLDWFAINVGDNAKLTFDFIAPTNSDTNFFKIGFAGSDAKILTGVDTGKDTTLNYSIKEGGTYYVYIWSDTGAGGYNYNGEQYSLKVTSTVGALTGSTNGDVWEPNDLFSQASSISLDADINGALSSKNDVDIFSIILTQSGLLDIEFTPPSGSLSDAFFIEILNKDLYTLDTFETGSLVNRVINIEESGEYYIRINAGSYSGGNYVLKASKKLSETIVGNEKEDNDQFFSANKLEDSSEITGELSSRYDVDFYKFTPSSNGSYEIKFDSPKDSYNPYYTISFFEEINSGGGLTREIKNKDITGRDIGNTYTVKSGNVYYIKVEGGNSDYTSEKYSITTNFYSDGTGEVSEIKAINGTTFDDDIIGTSSDDLIDPDSGNDIIRGKDGTDTVIIDSTSGSIDVRSLFNFDGYQLLTAGNSAGKYSNQYKRLIEVEKVQFIDKTLTIERDSSISSPSITFGSNDNRQIIGTNSSDNIDPIGGKHLIKGNLGNDKVLIFDSSRNFNIDTLEGITDIRAKDGNQTYDGSFFRLQSIEGVIFTDKEYLPPKSDNNYIFGSIASETIRGTNQDDIIDPLGGSDNIKGGSGQDKVIIFLPSSRFNNIETEGTISTLTGKSTAKEYAGKTITFENIETIVFTDRTVSIDIPGEYIISRERIEVSEGGLSESFQISLTAQPYKKVTVSISSNSSDITLSESSHEFTDKNWREPKSFSVEAFDDNEKENTELAKITISIKTEDKNYKDLLDKKIEVQINDNDKVGYNIAGTVWRDANQNEQKGGNENGLNDWLVYLDSNRDGQYTNGEIKTYTNENGNYEFTNLDPGTYYVAANIPTGWILTTPNRINTTQSGLDFTSSDLKLEKSGNFSNDVRSTLSSLLTAGDTINLDDFKNDSRFKDITGEGYTVVVIDGAVDLDHPFFGRDSNNDGIADKLSLYNYNYDKGRPISSSDADSHGTHVASIIGSSDPRYPGVAPGVNIISFEVFGEDTGGNIIQALRWTLENAEKYNIVAINMSLGANGENVVRSSPSYDKTFSPLLDQLKKAGVATIISSGNEFYMTVKEIDGENKYYAEDSYPGIKFPSSLTEAFSVGATYDSDYSDVWNKVVIGYESIRYSQIFEGGENPQDKKIAAFTNRGSDLDIFAPGAYIAAAKNNTSGAIESRGTSMAAPVISGVVALAQQLSDELIGRRLSVDELYRLIKTSGQDIYDGYAGGSDPREWSTVKEYTDDFGDTIETKIDPTDQWYKLVDVFALAEKILDLAPTGSYKVTVTDSDEAGSNFGFYPGTTDIASDSEDYIVGSSRSDFINSFGGNDTIIALSGNDTIDGGPGDDVLNGGSGNDKILFKLGKDKVDGGTGQDTLIFTERKSAVEISSSDYGYRATINSSNYVDFKNIEKIEYSNGTFSTDSLLSGLSAGNQEIKYSLTISSSSVIEGDEFFYTIQASQAPTSNENLSFQIEGDSIDNAVDTASSTDFETTQGNIIFESGRSSKKFSITIKEDKINEGLEGFKITILNSSQQVIGSEKIFIENKIPVTSNTDKATVSLSNEISFSSPVLESYSKNNSSQGTLNLRPSSEIIVITGSAKTYRGLNGDDHYFLSDLISHNTSLSIIDTDGNNIIQIPDNTFVSKSSWTSNAVRLTLSNDKVITINNADNFTFNIGGNIFANDDGSSLSYRDFASLFSIEIDTLNGSQVSPDSSVYINSDEETLVSSDGYKTGSSFDSNKPILLSFSNEAKGGGTSGYTMGDDIIVPIDNFTTYRGLGGNDTYIISSLSNENTQITIVDTAGDNIIQIVDNTKIVSSKWASDSFQFTLSNGSIYTINGADDLNYELGGNIANGDIGTTLDYYELANIFGVGISNDNSITTISEDYFII